MSNSSVTVTFDPIHTKIFKREDGSRVRIHATITTTYGNAGIWSFQVHTSPKGRRTWYSVVDDSDYSYRRLSVAERYVYAEKKSLEVVSPEEIQATLMELWEKIKPKYVKKTEDDGSKKNS
jgi:hypothetical protein